MASKSGISAEERERMIAEAAYFRSLELGFGNADPVGDWLEAEREVNARLEGMQHDKKLAQLYAQLAEANEKIRSAVASLKEEARDEWEEDVDRLHKLRDRFSDKLDEVRGYTGQAKQKAKRQADKLWEDLVDSFRRIGQWPE